MTETRTQGARSRKKHAQAAARKAKAARSQPSAGPGAKDWSTLQKRVREGEPFAAWRALKAKADATDKELQAVIGISPRTLERRREAGHFEPKETERLVRIDRILDLAMDVFEGDKSEAIAWLKRSNLALGGERPWNALDTEPGARMVEDALHRIEYGIHS